MARHFEWGRTTKGELPGREPIWLIFIVLMASAAGIAGGKYCWRSDYSGLQRWYFFSYVRSEVEEFRSFQGNGTGQYNVLALVDVRRPEKTLATVTDEDATVTTGKNGTLTLDLADKWIHRPYLQAVIHPIIADNGRMHDWLQEQIYGGQGILKALQWPFEMGGMMGVAVLLMGIKFSISADRRRSERRRDGRRVRGSKLLTTADFNRLFQSDGIGWINEAELTAWKKKAPIARIPRKAEANHLLLVGTTGAGKSTVILETLWQIEQRGEAAVIYDPDGFFLSHFYRRERGDVILNPLEARGAYWHPGDEVRDMAEALTMADSMFPTRAPQSQEYFHEGAKKVLARLLTFNPTPEDLTHWMAYPEEIDRRLAGTPQAQILSVAPGQRSGILGSLANGADSFALLVDSKEAEREAKPHWNSRLWAENPKGWIFLTSRTELRAAIRPITSLWFDLIVLRLLSRDPGAQIPVWCILDELASLDYLPQLHTALTEARRSNLRLIIGFQSMSQIETRYGKDASTILGMPKTKIYLRAGEVQAAQYIAENLGDIEVERISESQTYGERHTRTETRQKLVEKLILPSQVLTLPDRHGYLQHEGHVLPLSFPYRDIQPRAEPFVRRELPKTVLQEKPELPQQEQGGLSYFK
ncbi:MAG: type IV secretion system DNA-binding domain-containing protein [Sulfobacillus sp.]